MVVLPPVPQPNWQDDLRDFKKFGQPRLFFAVSAGNMDSMINHYTANRRKRSDDASDRSVQEDQSILIRKKLAELQAKSQAAILEQCDAMPSGYILNTPLEEIAFHLQLIERLETERVVLDVYNQSGDDYSELTICTFDDPQPGMLAKITGVLYGCNVDIHKAQAFTIEMKRPVVLDSLWIRCNGMQISESKARRIRSTHKEVLTGDTSIENFLKRAGKTPPGVGTPNMLEKYGISGLPSDPRFSGEEGLFREPDVAAGRDHELHCLGPCARNS